MSHDDGISAFRQAESSSLDSGDDDGGDDTTPSGGGITSGGGEIATSADDDSGGGGGGGGDAGDILTERDPGAPDGDDSDSGGGSGGDGGGGGGGVDTSDGVTAEEAVRVAEGEAPTSATGRDGQASGTESSGTREGVGEPSGQGGTRETQRLPGDAELAATQEAVAAQTASQENARIRQRPESRRERVRQREAERLDVQPSELIIRERGETGAFNVITTDAAGIDEDRIRRDLAEQADVDPSVIEDVDLEERDGRVVAVPGAKGRRELVRRRVAQEQDVDVEDVEVTTAEEGGFDVKIPGREPITAPIGGGVDSPRGGGRGGSRQALREQAAAQSPDVDPEDVKVERRDGEVVAIAREPTEFEKIESFRETAVDEGASAAADEAALSGAETIARAEGVPSSDVEKRFLPSLEVDVRERRVEFEQGDPVGATEQAVAERTEAFEESARDVEEFAGGSEVAGGVVGAAAAGVAAPEPVSTAGGAAIIGGVVVGSAAFEAQREDGEIEVPSGDVEVSELDVEQSGTDVSELKPAEQTVEELSVPEGEAVGELEVGVPTQAVSELAVGEESDSRQGRPRGERESVVPSEFPVAGRDFPADPGQEFIEETRPEDVVGRVTEAAPVGMQRERQRESQQQEREMVESLVLDEEIQRRRRAEERELDEILRGPEGTVMIGRRQFRGERERELLPTGAGVVAGELGRTEAAEAPELAEDADELLDGVQLRGQRETPQQLIGTAERGRQVTATTQDLDTRLDIVPSSVLLEESVFDSQTRGKFAMPTLTETVVVNKPGFPSSPVASTTPTPAERTQPPIEPDMPDRDKRRRDLGFFEREIIQPIEKDPAAGVDEAIKNVDDALGDL